MLPISFIEAIKESNYLSNFDFEPSYRDDVQFVEEKENYIFTMDLPGFKKENIKLDIIDNCLSVKATKKDEYSQDAKFYCADTKSNERKVKYGLPKNTALDKIAAKLENGLLKVEFPKKTGAKSVQIAIQ